LTIYKNAYLPPLKENLIKTPKGVYMVNSEITPTRIHQAYEDLMDFEKEFSALINHQRDLERIIR
jgi:hypothetical protein